MKKFKYTILSVLASAVMASCNFLDKEPYKITSGTYFQSEDEASSALTGVYAILAQSSFYGGDYNILAGGDDLSFYGGSSGRISNSGLICNLATTSDPAVTALWFTLYNGIERANYYIEQIDNVPDMSEKTRAQYKAEARFLRAFYYFNLVQNWGDVPFKTQSTVSTGSLKNKDIARTPKDDIYKFIVEEMAEVSDPENGGLLTASELGYLPGRVSKSTAWGILARVYMFWAGEHYRDNLPAPADKVDKFKEALKYGKLVQGAGHTLSPKYWDMFIDMCSDKYDTSGAHESIWEVEFAGDGTGDVRAEGRVGNTIGLMCPDFSSLNNVVGKNDPGYAYAFIWATPKLYDLYGYKAPYQVKKDADGLLKYNDDSEPTLENQYGTLRDDRFIWNIAPFGYRATKVKSEGIVGRTFDNKDLYYWVMGLGDFAGRGYGSRSYEYGLADDPIFNSNTTNKGDVWKKLTTSEGNRDQARKDLCCAKYRREYEPAAKKNKNNTSINFPLLRYSDVLLMMAEAENEVNGPADAYQYIDEVRERAGLKKLDRNFNQDTFREEIKDERARELCFEYIRRYDLIRWGEYIVKMNEQVTFTGEKYWSQGAQVANFFRIREAYNYFPIPESEKAVNKLITGNNPGW